MSFIINNTDIYGEECNNCTELLRAIQQCNIPKVEEILPLLSEEEINQPFGSHYVSALQLACALGSDKSELIAKLLIKHGANVKTTDNLGRTALHYAASNGQVETVKLLLKKGAHIDARYKANSLRSDTPFSNDYGLTKCLPVPHFWGRTALHQAVKYYHTEIVKVLLENGASVNIGDVHGITPILLAGAGISGSNIKCYEDIMFLLLSKGANTNLYNKSTGTTCLHHAVALNSYVATEALLEAGAVFKETSTGQTPLHEAAGRGYSDILILLLNYNDSSVNKPDKDGRTALHKAAFAGSRDCVRALTEHGGDLSARTKTNISVMDVIYLYVPRPLELIKEILNSKITCNNVSINDSEFRVTLDFKILSPRREDRQMCVISAMLDAGRNHQTLELLRHPLIESFLYLKWERLRMFFTMLVFLHIVFVISLSSYVMLIVHHPPWGDFLTAFTRNIYLLSAFFLFLNAVVQCMLLPRYYLKQCEMWLNILCPLISLVVTITGQTKQRMIHTEMEKSMSTGPGAPPKWAIHVTSITVLLAWMELMLLVGRLTSFGYYAIMFAVVLQNVVKVLLTFGCLVIGFALSFSVQFHTCEQFEDPWRAIVKTVVMMMGEFEYEDMFAEKGANGDLARLPATSRVIFIMFIILSSIVLMNLMVGVAVSDIQGLQREGHVKRLAKLAAFISHLEKVLAHRLLKSNWVPNILLYKHKCVNTSIVIKPSLRSTKHPENRKVRCIPSSTIETIVKLAVDNNTKFSNEEVADHRAIMAMLKNIEYLLNDLKLNRNSNRSSLSPSISN